MHRYKIDVVVNVKATGGISDKNIYQQFNMYTLAVVNEDLSVWICSHLCNIFDDTALNFFKLLMSVKWCGCHTGEQYVNIPCRTNKGHVLIDSKCDDLNVQQIRLKIL